jgi:hypothetical protein
LEADLVSVETGSTKSDPILGDCDQFGHQSLAVLAAVEELVGEYARIGVAVADGAGVGDTVVPQSEIEPEG